MDIVSDSLGLDAGIIRKDRETLHRQDLFRRHQLFLNETRIALSLSVRDHSRIQLVRWLKEKDCLIEFRANRGTKIALLPDSYFCLSCREKFYSFF